VTSVIAAYKPTAYVGNMAEAVQTARPHRKLPCGATSCGGCVKECGVVVYKYIAGLDLEDDRESYGADAPEVDAKLNVLNP
jgi:hypothetical protein